MKRLTPYEKVENFITKCRDYECEKWNAGLSNNLDEWDNFITYWSLIDEVASLRQDNAELRCYNDRLKNDLELKNKRYDELLKEYKALKKEYEYVTGDSKDDEDGWEF